MGRGENDVIQMHSVCHRVPPCRVPCRSGTMSSCWMGERNPFGLVRGILPACWVRFGGYTAWCRACEMRFVQVGEVGQWWARVGEVGQWCAIGQWCASGRGWKIVDMDAKMGEGGLKWARFGEGGLGWPRVCKGGRGCARVGMGGRCWAMVRKWARAQVGEVERCWARVGKVGQGWALVRK